MKKDKAYLKDILDAMVWETVKNKIPELKKQLLKVSSELNDS